MEVEWSKDVGECEDSGLWGLCRMEWEERGAETTEGSCSTQGLSAWGWRVDGGGMRGLESRGRRSTDSVGGGAGDVG